jgi:hypothetical protein
MPRWLPRIACCELLLSFVAALSANAAETNTRALSMQEGFGPYNVSFLTGGVGLSRPLAPDHEVLAAGATWSLSGWLRPTLAQQGTVVLAAIGDVRDADGCRCLVLEQGQLAAWLGSGVAVRSASTLEVDRWQAIAVTYDGSVARLYLNGMEIATSKAATSRIAPVLHLAPHEIGVRDRSHFGGSWADFRLHAAALSAQEIAQLFAAPPRFDLTVFHEVGVGWPWQQRAWRGLQQPQDAWTLPRTKTPPSAAVAQPLQKAASLVAKDTGTWTVNGWRLIEESKAGVDGAELSQPQYRDADWHVATVPGTVLTTLIDRGVYPDPDYGLNNMAIPETLARQSYWYRTVFDVPAGVRGRNLTLSFKGVNYAAEVWLNGARIGDIEGAFTRGMFDVTKAIHTGRRNALAVRVSPPPHPGIAHEESIAAGPGENGGNMAIDGPTFVASEGWDWIPAMRDRNTGIWQDVELRASGRLRLLDPHIVTRLPLPRTDTADVSIAIAVFNTADSAVQATVGASFGDIAVEKRALLPSGKSVVTLDAREFPQLRVARPRLWWPNGYGPAELYSLKLRVEDANVVSDSTTVRFGIRHITYELSLFDRQGRLRRVEVDPASSAERLVDVRHEAIKKAPNGWAASLTPAGETSQAVRAIATESLAPYLAIRVNGVPIAVRGGNWGMDDSRKRIARNRLQPYFELHRAANLNTVRNWLGQNTQEVFYDLADEYGLLVLNDFWASTQDFQVEPQDPALFLANARDVIERYRNHPSIALWFGRNEGVPQPILNEGLADLVATLDGTRYFNGSSNSVNLQGSGPYNYRPPEQYFTELAQGFSVEVGTPSLSTLESLRASIPEADRWPPSDTLAYHDWHFGGNGDVATFMKSLAAQYGAADSLEDFERKAQMMNYVTYRALFEGFNAGLWTRNSGRLLWMTHPSWPSNTWQIYSSDYDTHAAYYGVKKASEPLHVQMNLPDFRLVVVNTTRHSHADLQLRSRVLALDNRVLEDRTLPVTAGANAVTTLDALELTRHLVAEDIALVTLALIDKGGRVLSENLYWQGRNEESHRRLHSLGRQPVSVQVRSAQEQGERSITAQLTNRGTRAALAAKLTMLDDKNERVLPAFYSDNYISLLPGESRSVTIRCPASGARCQRIGLRGWNVEPASITIPDR